MLSEYYKYHRDHPLEFDLGVSSILAKYHQKLKKIDFKRITEVIRKEKIERGETVSSRQSSFDSEASFHSDVDAKSKYSNMLEDLKCSRLDSEKEKETKQKETNKGPMSESQVLMDICQKIGQAYG